MKAKNKSHPKNIFFVFFIFFRKIGNNTIKQGVQLHLFIYQGKFDQQQK
jgi:hypothetical protein